MDTRKTRRHLILKTCYDSFLGSRCDHIYFWPVRVGGDSLLTSSSSCEDRTSFDFRGSNECPNFSGAQGLGAYLKVRVNNQFLILLCKVNLDLKFLNLSLHLADLQVFT